MKNLLKNKITRPIFLGFLIVNFSVSFSQPQWKFHIAYEDATGARDTMWFIWDESATFFGIDTLLGEGNVQFNYETFNVWALTWGVYPEFDTTKVIAIPYDSYFEVIVDAFNFVLPITISWDTSLLHAPFLPPDPVGWVNHARLDNDYFFLVNNMPFGGNQFNMTITDYVVAPDPNITDPWFWEPGRHFPMFIFLHQDPSTVIINDDGHLYDLYSIAPNPARDKLTIRFPRETAEIKVFNNLGRQVFGMDVNSNGEIIDISHYTNGIYFINFINLNNQNHYEKFIKTD